MIVCFDIGGSAIKAAAADSADRIGPVWRKPTPTGDYDAFVDVLRAGIAAVGGRPDKVAISIAGVTDRVTGAAVVANIPCLSGHRLAPELSAALGVPVRIANDADCFALAEAGVGAGVGHDVVFGAILGTGIGGGLVAGGRLVATRGYCGEWGHGPVAQRMLTCLDAPLPAFRCGCGLDGCLDAICSARGIEKLHRHLTGADLSSIAVLEAWHGGDGAAALTVRAWLELIAGPLAMVVNLTGATIVPVGGGLSNDAALIAALDGAVRPLTLAKPDGPLVVRAACRTEPGLIGAAVLALQEDDRDAA
ncbi:MAG: N-acetylglucosamine kinase [Rhodobacteraceae bacterium]|nr:N-acetylglucosamine kinase [Paracoccaceae bacterium]MAY47804.1 N-acetylglucosamine kinase [Paracoccaceae bacterium]